MTMVEKKHPHVSIVKQCELLQIGRSGFYYEPAKETDENLSIMRLLDEQYLETPFFGVERLLVLLMAMGYKINKKRLRRLMKLVGWQTPYPQCKHCSSYIWVNNYAANMFAAYLPFDDFILGALSYFALSPGMKLDYSYKG
jgi:hypothetical protein